MKVTLLIDSAGGGGAERVVCNIANYLVGKGHEITLLLFSNEKSYYIDERVRCVWLKPQQADGLPRLIVNVVRLYRMNRYLRKEQQDIYVTFLPMLTFLLFKQRHFFKAPVIYAERCEPQAFCNQSEKNKHRFNKYFPMAEGFVFQTEDAKSYFDRVGIDVRNSVVIPNAVNSAFVGHRYEGERRKSIVSAGRLDEQKNYGLLIDAFALMRQRLPGYKLIIYGEGPQRKMLEKKISDLGLEDVVSFPGRTEKIVEALQDASLFVLPSNYEGMPNALAEAMALGLPCVATDCPAGGSRFLIKDGENGILVPVGNENTMAEAMYQVLSDESYARNIAQHARLIADDLTPDKTYGAWERFISEVVSER